MALKNPPVTTRKYVYRVVNAALAAAVIYGLVNGDQSAALLLFANAALGLADVNATE